MGAAGALAPFERLCRMTLTLLPLPEVPAAVEAPRRRRVNRAGESRTSPRKGAEDFIVTPRWAVDALLEREVFPGPVWEPACGDGAISEVLEAAGYQVFSKGGLDFLQTTGVRGAQSIVTNPPFSLATEFAVHAVETLGARKVAMFGRIGFLEGQRRGAWFERFPPSRTWVFSARVDMWAGGADLSGPPQVANVAFAWFVWERHHPPSPTAWIRDRPDGR